MIAYVCPSVRRVTGSFAMAFVVAMCFSSCGFWSETELVKSSISPNGVIVADWYQISGGGAAGWSRDRVRLRPANEKFATGNDYSFDAISADKIELEWASDTELRVRYPSDAAVTKSEPKWNDIAIALDPTLKP